jgi:hypothetical protein
MEYRFGGEQYERLDALARVFARLQVDVIFAASSPRRPPAGRCVGRRYRLLDEPVSNQRSLRTGSRSGLFARSRSWDAFVLSARPVTCFLTLCSGAALAVMLGGVKELLS